MTMFCSGMFLQEALGAGAQVWKSLMVDERVQVRRKGEVSTFTAFVRD